MESKRYRIGGAKRDRTADPLRARQVLSQLSYDPVLDRHMSNLRHMLLAAILKKQTVMALKNRHPVLRR